MSPLFHIIFPQSGASGQPQAVLPQCHHSASPCWCFPHPNGLPWANTQHQVHSSLFLAWELIPTAQDKRHKPAVVLDNSSSHKRWSQSKPGLPAHFWMHPACSGTRGPAPLTVGERHFCHKGQCQDGWELLFPVQKESYPDCEKEHSGSAGTAGTTHTVTKSNTSPGTVLTWPDIAEKYSNKTHKAITNFCHKKSRATLCALCPLPSHGLLYKVPSVPASSRSWL